VNRLRALILDFDGVLIESNALKTEAFAAVFARFPEHADDMMAFHHAHVSASRYDKFRNLVTTKLNRPPDDPLVEELAAAFSREMRARLERCAWVPGATALLDRVRGRLPVYLASVTPEAELAETLSRRGLTGAFAGVYGCPPWTKDRAIADIIDRTGGASDVLFIGDSAGDQRAARAADVEFIARDSGLPFDDPQPHAYRDLTAIAIALQERLP
jgi:phosphoglycolate phosphatase-like HAD superfamily hydrolase